MSHLNILRTYALSDPAKIPSAVLFSNKSTSLTIYDAFPKSIFHFLVLPRMAKEDTTSDLTSLKTVLMGDKAYAKKIISALAGDAKILGDEIEGEMLKRYGFKWDIWTGFHAVPSMKHLHLHVLSTDLCSGRMKLKKHYNSFHPKLGFFLDIDAVLTWFDAEPSYFEGVSKLEAKAYEAILKEDLVCWSCNTTMKNMPTLKAHLQGEWNRQAKLGRKADKGS
ncbi:HIT-like domain-containing protein [Collybia nuda]|uniref:HIT-like domain-containing protein n=1 Tax=Collybia nuda TaxID=64659 RepID=A0A9P6C9C3_9AGAR|nr:HIT-like domain-containing protein [Collybia nuda]